MNKNTPATMNVVAAYALCCAFLSAVQAIPPFGNKSLPLTSPLFPNVTSTVSGNATGHILNGTSTAATASPTQVTVVISILTATDGSNRTALVTWTLTDISLPIVVDGFATAVPTAAWSCQGPLCDQSCLIPLLCKASPVESINAQGGIDGFNLPQPPSAPAVTNVPADITSVSPSQTTISTCTVSIVPTCSRTCTSSFASGTATTSCGTPSCTLVSGCSVAAKTDTKFVSASCTVSPYWSDKSYMSSLYSSVNAAISALEMVNFDRHGLVVQNLHAIQWTESTTRPSGEYDRPASLFEELLPLSEPGYASMIFPKATQVLSQAPSTDLTTLSQKIESLTAPTAASKATSFVDSASEPSTKFGGEAPTLTNAPDSISDSIKPTSSPAVETNPPSSPPGQTTETALQPITTFKATWKTGPYIMACPATQGLSEDEHVACDGHSTIVSTDVAMIESALSRGNALVSQSIHHLATHRTTRTTEVELPNNFRIGNDLNRREPAAIKKI